MIILVDGIIYASVLSVLCVGLTLTYKMTNIPNFAHTTFAILGMYMTLITVKIFEMNPYFSLPLAFLMSGLTALFLYYFVIRILQKRKSSFIVLIIATLSFDIFMIGVLNILADFLANTYQITTRDFTLRSDDIIIFDISFVLIASIIAICTLVAGLYILLYRTRLGLGMRASIDNTGLAKTMGIDTNKIFCISWFLSGGLGGIAGVLMSMWFQGDPGLSTIMLPSIFAGSIVGGFSSIYGAILGGFVVGISEIMGTNFLASIFGYGIVPYRPIIPFLFIIVTLLVLPKGIAHVIPQLVSKLRGSTNW